MSDPSWFHVSNADEIASPALLVWPDRVAENIRHMLEAVDGDASRLRPHVKTHKMAEVVRMQVDAGITRFKCATIAEVEMTAAAGGTDVLLAYQPVGPNIARMEALADKFPATSFAALVDDMANLKRIADHFHSAGKVLRLFVDIDCGMGRTGIAPGDGALALCRAILDLEGVSFGGLHIYDGHIHDVDAKGRGQHFEEAQHVVEPFHARLAAEGIEVPLIVGGGSPTFPWHARLSAAFGSRYQCSPGTTLLWDSGYGTKHPDLPFLPAAALLVRVISKPGTGRVCVDLGHKAVSGENPIGNRVRFPELTDPAPLMQSEEHLVVETTSTEELAVGDVIYGIPWHICPTVALHQEAVVIRNGHATGERWEVVSRNRRITL
ncbi:MAG: D-TA family PLP-dependent enzyme [Verrucomicrobiae bacterium]|nr:D-TA family PLP-dependent enzyme [Verrucomicrobiae bacterium]